MKTYECIFTLIYCSALLSIRNVSRKSCIQNQNTHFMFNKVFPKIALYMLHYYGYKQTLRACNTYCFFYSHDGYRNASQCYLTRKVSDLLSLCLGILLHVPAKSKRLSPVKINYGIFFWGGGFNDK
jgi:hypothetical protein